MARDNKENLFALCVNDGGYPESLEVRKVYRIVPDEKAEARKYIRIIDETEEDYLYPAALFVMLNLPAEIGELMQTIAAK